MAELMVMRRLMKSMERPKLEKRWSPVCSIGAGVPGYHCRLPQLTGNDALRYFVLNNPHSLGKRALEYDYSSDELYWSDPEALAMLLSLCARFVCVTLFTRLLLLLCGRFAVQLVTLLTEVRTRLCWCFLLRCNSKFRWKNTREIKLRSTWIHQCINLEIWDYSFRKNLNFSEIKEKSIFSFLMPHKRYDFSSFGIFYKINLWRFAITSATYSDQNFTGYSTHQVFQKASKKLLGYNLHF